MSANRGDGAAHRAAEGWSRRKSLVGLGGATLAAALTGPTIVKAGTAGKKAKKKCKKQGAPCRDFANELCAFFFPPGTDRDECVTAASACCSPLTRCQGGPFFDCALEVIQNSLPD